MKHTSMTRRQALLSLPAIAALAQTKTPIRVRAFSHATLTVSDRKRSVEFYQGLFGLPTQHRQGNSQGLRIGPGLQYISLSQAQGGAKPGIAHFCMTVDQFNIDAATKALAAHGVTKGEPGPMKTWVRVRRLDAGGDKDGTPEFYLGDPDGLNIQLQDVTYCGGSGPMGNVCKPAERAPTKGLLAIADWSHFTLGVSDRARSTAFYQNVFGLSVQAHQGAVPLLAVGARRQFLTMGGVNGAGATPSIAHGCFVMNNFNPDRVLKALSDYGIKPRGSAAGPPGPLVSYISMRMEDRGGARGGTPELYFTDPDGILMQIQDVTYCGGGGYLGELCG